MILDIVPAALTRSIYPACTYLVLETGAIFPSADTVFRSTTRWPPHGSFDKPLHPAALFFNLGKEEALEFGLNAFDLDGTCHSCGQLVAIPEELMTRGLEIMSAP